MMPWHPVERRWRDAMIAAMIPALAEIERGPFWERWDRGAPVLLQLGLRAGVWIVALGALRHGRTFPALSPDDQDRLLVGIVGHRWYLLRQAGVVLKLCASMALAHDAGSRARFEPRKAEVAP